MPGDPIRAVFLSYASQDAAAARKICDTLRGAGVEVWFDADGGLEHGDEWDAKIRRQIKECVLFLPVISANTQARHEGYFRLEWDLAAERARTIASGVPFILPVVIDDTREPDALVPDRFRTVQWTRLPGGEMPPAVLQRYLKLWSHRIGAAKAARSGQERPRDDGSTSAVAPATADPVGTAPPASPSASRRMTTVGWIAGAVAVAGIALFILQRPISPDAAPTHPTAVPAATSEARPAQPNSVAVLPFVNQSADPDNEYFSDGIADELLTTLQKIPGLRVAARTSAWSFKGKDTTAQEVGAKLGMAHVVEGSVQKSGTRVKITARLSRAATNEAVWSRSFGPFDLEDVFKTQSELAQAIVAELRGRLTGGTTAISEIQSQVQAAAKGGTSNLEAHQLYLQGKFFLTQHTVESAIRAAGLLRRAVELDPNFALAWAALSEAGRTRSGFGDTKLDFDEGLKVAREAADRALALAPDLVAALLAQENLFRTHDFDWKRAAESLQRAAALAPFDPAVLTQKSELANALGQAARAVEFGRQAAALDPVNPRLLMNLGYALTDLRRYDEARAEFQRITEISPTAPWGYSGLGIMFTAQGKAAEAVEAAAKVTTKWERLYVLTIAEWARGNRAASDSALNELIASAAEIAASQIAWAYAYRREADRAFEWLERAYRQRDGGLSWSKSNFALESLHPDPRWPAFWEKFGLHDDQLRDRR